MQQLAMVPAGRAGVPPAVRLPRRKVCAGFNFPPLLTALPTISSCKLQDSVLSVRPSGREKLLRSVITQWIPLLSLSAPSRDQRAAGIR